MKKLALLILISLSACQPADQEQDTSKAALEATGNVAPAAVTTDGSQQEWTYPETARVDQTDDYHGTVVADPYRWLEDDVRESEAVADWVEAQNEVTFAYLETIPERSKIKERLTSLWDYEKFGVPFRQGGKIFYFGNNGLQNQSVLYSQYSLDSEPRQIIDPNTFSDDGTVALADVEISPDGRYAAMAIQDGGSDWRMVRVLEIETGKELDDKLEWVKFSGMAWAADSSGFYYSRFPTTEEGAEFQSLNKNQKIYFHAVNTPQNADLQRAVVLFRVMDEDSAGELGADRDRILEAIDELLYRLDIVPPGLALGQAAYESGYGTSRFAAEGNVLFGQWTYGGEGLVPGQQRAQLGDYRIAAFEWPFDSVRGYFINLMSHPAYEDFRRLRAERRAAGQPLSSLALADGLLSYSERGQVYVDDLKGIIRVNKLEAADRASLREEPLRLTAGADGPEAAAELRREFDAMRASGELAEMSARMRL